MTVVLFKAILSGELPDVLFLFFEIQQVLPGKFNIAFEILPSQKEISHLAEAILNFEGAIYN